MTSSSVKYVNGRKTFIPLENNPETLSLLCRNLGVSPSLAFHDVLSTTAPDLLALIPRPVNAVIFLAERAIYQETRSHVVPTIPAYTGSGPQEPVLWMKQTIGHACGLMALLHCVLNVSNGRYVMPDSQLEALMKQAVQLAPKERADLLYNSDFLEEAHMNAAEQGASRVPSPEEDNGFHFIGFVKMENGRVWELNGGLNGPFLRGSLGEGEDLLSERGLELTVNDFLDVATRVKGGVSMVALTKD